MSDHPKRILFLCTKRSVRALMAASLLAVHAEPTWDIWIAPGIFASEEIALARQVLAEKGVLLLSSPQTAEPSVARSW